VRPDVKNVRDLKGKAIALSRYSPSHYFLLDMLFEGGLQPTDVDMRFTKTTFEAAAAFNADKTFAGAVSWAPDIYNLTKAGTGNRMLVSTSAANKLIADVWFGRADFAKANPEIIEGLVRGIVDAVADLKDRSNQDAVAAMMDTLYQLDKGTGKQMLGDAHWASYAENKDFFLDPNNPTNFERSYNTAYRLYRAIHAPVAPRRTVDLEHLRTPFAGSVRGAARHPWSVSNPARPP
jgi:ABC-type nitrate/sulfonate/bicarbonate transport system substrate-binding protein